MKVVMALSGGMDSATLYWKALSEGHTVYPMSVDYGQRHHRELVSAAALVERAAHRFGNKAQPRRIADMTGISAFMGGSSQTDPDVEVPEGHYADENMKLTVVPNRNMLIIAAATAWAISEKADEVWYGAHAGDHDIYPDCRPQFVKHMAKAVAHADWHGVRLAAPLIHMDKGEIAAMGLELRVPFELTWTCYKGKHLACGKCGSCTERLEAFSAAGCIDPIEYEA